MSTNGLKVGGTLVVPPLEEMEKLGWSYDKAGDTLHKEVSIWGASVIVDLSKNPISTILHVANSHIRLNNGTIFEEHLSDFIPTGAQEKTNTIKCTCDMFTLMNYGCKCGGFKAEQLLKGK